MGASGSKTPTIICCGLDAAGKSTMLYQIAQLHHADEPETSIPAIGLNVEALEAGGLRFVSWDLSGHSWHRPLWRHYFQSAQCLVFVVDSSDMERIDNAREELSDLLSEEFDGRKDWPVLVLVCVRARARLRVSLFPFFARFLTQPFELLVANRRTSRACSRAGPPAVPRRLRSTSGFQRSLMGASGSWWGQTCSCQRGSTMR